MRNWREVLLEHTDLVELVSEYLTLERAGKNYKAICPFHSEKTPSFFVSPSLNRFHCFGCGASGDAITFLMRIEGLSFREALKRLADRAGVEIQEDALHATEVDRHRETLYRAVYAAHFYYRQCLKRTPHALEYLQSRGLTAETIERFELGYAPDGWDYLVRFLEKHQIPLADAHEAGLVEARQNGYYDRFRDRITFPIHDAGGRVIAFGARTMGNDEPKYLNSPETPLFEKRNLFYGWHLARGDILKQRTALIVEGYLDLIMLHQHGFPHAVATLGTAFTEGHAQRLKRLVDKVYLMYDSDPAGVRAVLRAGEVLMQAEIPTFVARLPEGEDPDSFLRQHGADALHHHIQQANTLAVFGVEQIIQNYLQQSNATQRTELEMAVRTQLLQEALEWVARVPNPVEQITCLEKLVPFSPTATLGTPVVLETLRNELHRLRQRQQRRNRNASRTDRAQEEARTPSEPQLPKGLIEAERTVLRAWLQPHYYATIQESLPRLRWAEPLHARMARWLEAHLQGGLPADLRELLNILEEEALHRMLTAFLIQETPALTPELVQGCLVRMEQYAKKLRLDELKQAGNYNEEYWSLLKELKAVSPTPKGRNSTGNSE